MNKVEVLKNLFLLSQEEILDIYEILNGYKCTINKANNDTLALISVYMAGYHSTREFFKKFNITKDCSIANLLRGSAFNIKTYLEFKDMLNIDDDMFLAIIKGSDGNE